MSKVKTVTMKDIANALHISIVSVSKALSGKEGVSAKVREQILEKADEMGYRYKTPEKSAEEASYHIGILLAEHFLNSEDASFYARLSNYVIVNLSARGCFGRLEVVTGECEDEKTPPAILSDEEIQAIIVLGQFSPEYLDMIVEKQLPVTFLDFYNEKSNIDSVVCDNTYGAYILTEYLIKNGHRKIGFIGNIHATSSILDRYLGYYKALIENDLEPCPDWILEDRAADGRLIPIRLPASLPTAFVCNCDEVAYKIIGQLKENNIRVPEDISVVGYDDHIFATLSDPKLTTFSSDMPTMAKEAVNSVLARLEGSTEQTGRRKVISGRLIVRDSVKEIIR